jgi:hypothetical protein
LPNHDDNSPSHDGFDWDIIRRNLSRIGLGAIYVAGIASLLVGLGQQLDFPPGLWGGNPLPLLTGALLAFIYVAAAERIRILQNRVRDYSGQIQKLGAANKRLRDLQAIDGVCHTLLMAVANRTSLAHETLSVHVWTVGGDGQRLHRLITFQIHSGQRSDVTWTRGKGAIGRCWAESADIVVDLDRLKGLNRTDFNAEEEPVRLHMEWDEFRRASRYSSIWATPLKDGNGQFFGCVSVDSDAPGSAAQMKSIVDDKEIQGLIEVVRNYVLAL